MKLIDAKKFATGIALMKISFLESGDGKETEYKRGAIATMEAIKKLLEEVPADYDVDAVVQQLEDRSTLSRPAGWPKSYEIVTLEDAIEIVEDGGAIMEQEENIKVTAASPPKSCTACIFFGAEVDGTNGTCFLTGYETDIDTADKGIMANCKIKKRKRKKGKATKGEIRTNFDACCESIENMAAVLDIAKIGWTKEQLVKWLKEANNTEFQEAEHD